MFDSAHRLRARGTGLGRAARGVLAGFDPEGVSAARMLILGLVLGVSVDLCLTLRDPATPLRGLMLAAVLAFVVVNVAYALAARHAFSAPIGVVFPLLNLALFAVAGACGSSQLWYAAVFPAAWLGLHFGYRGLMYAIGLASALALLGWVVGTGDKTGHQAITAWLAVSLAGLPSAIAQTSFAHASRSLISTRRTQRSLTDAVDVGLLFVDRDGNAMSMNPQMEAYLRLAMPDHLPAGTYRVFESDGVTPLPLDDMPIQRVFAHGDFERTEIWIGDDPQTQRALAVSGRRMLDERGHLEGATFAFHDVTALVRAVRVRDHFVSSVSHELRTPLTSIIGFVELCQAESLSQDVSGYLDRIHHNAWRLHHLVEDLLAAADKDTRLESPRLVDLAALLDPVLASVAVLARDGGVSVEGSVTETQVLGDAKRLEQVLVNLVANAVKYTPSGGQVRVEIGHDDGWAHIRVSDTGIGIAPEETDRLFDRFYRSASARSSPVPGIGLGLSITREIVRAHGGTVSVTSEVGFGSTFEVKLPLGTSVA